MGVRAHHVHFAASGEENAFACDVVRVIQDVFSTIVLLRPEGAASDAPLLRMELEPDAWQAVPDKTRCTVALAPQDILLLK
jgi:molybdate transport system ATP-binding protein